MEASANQAPTLSQLSMLFRSVTGIDMQHNDSFEGQTLYTKVCKVFRYAGVCLVKAGSDRNWLV